MANSPDTRLRRLTGFLIRYRLFLLPGVFLLTLSAWPFAAQLSFDQSIESLYAEDDPYLGDYLESKSLFGGDEFVIVAYSHPNLFVPDSLQLSDEAAEQIRDLAGRLSSVPGVRKESTQNLADSLKFKWRRRKVRKLVEGVLVGSDNQTTAVVLRLIAEQETDVPRGETIKEIRKIAKEFDKAHNLLTVDDESVFVVGEPVQIHDMFRYVEEDGDVLFRVSLFLLALVLFMLFRSLRWVVLPLIVVVATIVWTEAILVLSGMRLSMVSSILNSLVTIIGIATVTHVTVHYREQRRRFGRTESLERTLFNLLPAIFWTCATTAAGFTALLSSGITPVRSFGTMMSLGTLLVLAASATVLPGGILIGRFSADPGESPVEERLLRFLGRVTHWVEHRPRVLIGSTVGVVAAAAFGLLWLKPETDFSKNFRASSPIVRSLNFVETNLGGAGTWEVSFPAPGKLTAEYLDRVGSLAQRLRALTVDGKPQLTKVVCLRDGVDLVPRIPFLTNTLRKRLNRLQSFQPEFESSLYNPERGRMRIMLRARERQASESKLHLIAQAEQLAREEFPDAKATGLFVLLAHLIESLLRDQLVSFVLAAIGIGGMMAIAFRSVWIGLISLIPNLFPIVLVIGTMGWIGLPINIATAMIASVSMGLTVDSSIHYISGYRRARREQLGVIEALRVTHQEVGLALVFANVALIVGFSVLTLSHFIPLVYFGILVSVAMLGGLIGNLVLLPLLLRMLEKSVESRESEGLRVES